MPARRDLLYFKSNAVFALVQILSNRRAVRTFFIFKAVRGAEKLPGPRGIARGAVLLCALIAGNFRPLGCGAAPDAVCLEPAWSSEGRGGSARSRPRDSRRCVAAELGPPAVGTLRGKWGAAGPCGRGEADQRLPWRAPAFRSRDGVMLSAEPFWWSCSVVFVSAFP